MQFQPAGIGHKTATNNNHTNKKGWYNMDIGIYNQKNYETVVTTDRKLAQYLLDNYKSATNITMHDNKEDMKVYYITYRKDEKR